MNRTSSMAESPLPSDHAPSVANASTAYSARNQRCEQIIQNFYTKVTQTLLQARMLSNTPTSATLKKVNKWFNLELEDYKTYKTELKYWRTACLSTPSPSPMILEIYLDATELNHRQILVLNDDLMQKVKVDVGNGSLSSHLKYIDKISKKQTILLESWQLFLIEPANSSVVDLPIVYKKSIVFFRSLYTYVRQLPTYRLYRQLRKMKLKGLKLGYRLTTSPTLSENEIGIDTLISETDSHGSTSKHAFDPIDTPLGSFVLNVKYRSNCNFCVEDPEAVLSSKFTTTDKEVFLTSSPTEIDSQLKDHSYGNKCHGSLEDRGYKISHINSHRSSHGPSRIKGTTIDVPEDYPKPFLSSISRTGSSPSTADYDIHRFSQPSNQQVSPSFSPIGSKHYLRTRSLSSPSGKNTIYIDENENSCDADDRIDIYGVNQISSNISRRPIWNQNSSIYSRSPSSRPLLSLISPFKSPSLSTSPTSIHEISISPSPTGLRKKNSSTSLHQHYINPSASRFGVTPPLSKASAGTTKLASSFGNRFSSDLTREDPRSSQGLPRRRRTTSLLSNDGLYGTSGRLPRPQSRALVTTSLPGNDDVGDFVNLIDTRAPLKMFDVTDATRKGNTVGKEKNGYQYSLTRFHQLRQENSILSESFMATSAAFSSSSEAARSHSEDDSSNQIPEPFDHSSREDLDISSGVTSRHQNTQTSLKPLLSLSVPNSCTVERNEGFRELQASILKYSKSVSTMKKNLSSTEFDSEIESEERSMHRSSAYNKPFFNNTEPFPW